MNRGDVVLVRFPHPSGLRGKKRPAVIVQSDAYTGTTNTLVVAEITKNLAMAGDPACLFIDVNTPEGKATSIGLFVADHAAEAQRPPENSARAALALTPTKFHT